MLMTIQDIARLAKVSVATVSRVLNGSASVTEQTKDKVLSVIHEHDYTPNAFARGLGLNSMRTAGILCVDPADPNACPSLQFAIGYVQRELRKQNYDSLLYCISYDMEEKESSIQSMLDRRVDAIIIIGSFFIENAVKNNLCIIKAADTTPVWLVNGALPNVPNVYSVRCDDFIGTHTVTQSMIAAGSKDILMLYNASTYSEQQKIKGYQAALDEAGIPVRGNYIRRCGNNVHTAMAELESQADSGLKFDGVVATEDELAIGALKFAASRLVAVPEQLRVAGYANSKLAVYSTPELTSVDHNVESLCITTVALLVNQLMGKRTPTDTVVKPELVYRESFPNPMKLTP